MDELTERGIPSIQETRTTELEDSDSTIEVPESAGNTTESFVNDSYVDYRYIEKTNTVTFKIGSKY